MTKIDFGSAGTVLLGDSLPYQETFTFKSDSTYTQYRSTPRGKTTGRYTSRNDIVNHLKIIELLPKQALNPLVHYIKGIFYRYDNQPEQLIFKLPVGARQYYYQQLKE